MNVISFAIITKIFISFLSLYEPFVTSHELIFYIMLNSIIFYDYTFVLNPKIDLK